MSWASSMALETGSLPEPSLRNAQRLPLVLRDRALAASVTRHFRGLIERGLLRALPQE